ncbi:protein containing DUF132 [mine drainage metagenome]|uniref:Protein containing DUF132 n=2 Tax=mine drainage metagenome TaxID=410659 RepID=T1CM92_9ZZZZ
MGTQGAMTLRVVFDTTAVVSALLFPSGRLAWLRAHWAERRCTPLISRATAAELARVLAYPRFRLSVADRHELLGDYLPYCETVHRVGACPQGCRDATDQMFLDLAHVGYAQVLVSGDKDLLALVGQTGFAIEAPAAYRERVSGPK